MRTGSDDDSDDDDYIEGVDGSDLTGTETVSVTPEQHERLKEVIYGDALFDRIRNSERRYLVVGRGDGEAGKRRKTVRDLLDERRSAVGFRLEDFGLPGDEIELWAPAFDVLSEVATHTVGVLEDYDGGHVWELGLLYHRQRRVRNDLWLLKRFYPDDEVRRDRYDNGMAASHLFFLEEAVEERVLTWETVEELEEAVGRIP